MCMLFIHIACIHIRTFSCIVVSNYETLENAVEIFHYFILPNVHIFCINTIHFIKANLSTENKIFICDVRCVCVGSAVVQYQFLIPALNAQADWT